MPPRPLAKRGSAAGSGALLTLTFNTKAFIRPCLTGVSDEVDGDAVGSIENNVEAQGVVVVAGTGRSLIVIGVLELAG